MKNKYSVAKKTKPKAREKQRLLQTWVPYDVWTWVGERAAESLAKTRAAYLRQLIDKDRKAHARAQNR
jgi:hypothetical protein